MDMYLQFGYGMMEHCSHLVRSWGGGTVVLSPRDLTPEQIPRFSAQIQEIPDGEVVFDPQFYLPHADHARLCSHGYWPQSYSTSTFWTGPALATLLSRLRDLNESIGSRFFILPGLLATAVDDDWLATQRAVMEEALALGCELPLFLTIALSGDVTRNQGDVETLLEECATWSPTGYYLVFEHPNESYLVDDTNWLANVLDIVSGLRLSGSAVVIGYCNHQQLVSVAARPTAICSGIWMNVRAFPPDKFMESYEEEIKQRTTWYYCPQAYSEYKIPFLDNAYRLGVLDGMSPPPGADGGYVQNLFSGVQPSTMRFSETSAFRHYLHSLRHQALSLEKPSFDGTVQAIEDSLDTAEQLLSTLHASGVRGQHRDFSKIVDVNRAALEVLKATRGAILRREWNLL